MPNSGAAFAEAGGPLRLQAKAAPRFLYSTWLGHGMRFALRATVALLIVASLPTFEAAPGDLVGSGYIEIGGPALGSGIFASPQPPAPGQDDGEPSAFWLDVTPGIWVETRTTTSAATGLPHAWAESYDINIRVWGQIRESGGGSVYDSWGFFATCELPTAEEVCHMARAPSSSGGYTYTYTAEKIFVVAARGIDLNVEVYEIAQGANPPVPLIDQARHVLFPPEPEPGPRTQTFELTAAHILAQYGYDFLVSGPPCTVRIDHLQPDTGFYLENIEGAHWDIRFFSYDGSWESHVSDFHGAGDDWGNVPATADWACAELEGDFTPLTSFAYTDGLAKRASTDHSTLSTYRVYHG